MQNTIKLNIRKKYDKTIIFFLNLKLNKFKEKFSKELKKMSLNVPDFETFLMRFYRDKYDNLIKFKVKKNKNILDLIKIKLYLFVNLVIFCLNTFLNSTLVIFLLIKKNKKNSLTEENILVDSFYGCSNWKKNDLPFSSKKINPQKIIFLVRNKEIYENCKLDVEFSNERSLLFLNNKIKIMNIINKIPLNLDLNSRVMLFKLLLRWFFKPLQISIILKFYTEYLIYSSIINFYNIKIYIDPKPGTDLDSIILSYAISKNLGESISFQRSFLSSKEHSILVYGCKTLICWSNQIQKTTHHTNNIKKFIFSPPPFGTENLNQNYISKLKKKIKQHKVVTIFDTSFTSGIGLFSREIYNEAINFILKQALLNKNIFIILKLKNHLSMKNIYEKNKKLLNELFKEDRLIVEDQIYKSNNEIIYVSDLICSFNSLTIFAEGVYQQKKGLVFNNLSFENELIKDINNIDNGSCVNNLDDFKKFFKLKINIDSKDIDLTKLKNFIFTKNNTINETLISNYFI